MRIAVLSNAFPPHYVGGAARIAEMQVTLLREAGHEVRVWSPPIPWFHSFCLWRFFYHLSDLAPRKDLVAEITAWKPETLVTHNLTGLGFGTPCAVRRGCQARWVHVLHDVQLFEPSGRMRRHRFTFWQRAWAAGRRRSFCQPDLVLSPTHWLMQEHVRRGFFKDVPCEIIPNSASPLESLQRLESHQPMRLLFVGRVSLDKGARMLRRLAKTIYFPFELRIVGAGPWVPFLKKRSGVVALGQLSKAEVLAQMKEADVLLVPSQIAENQPTVILEAASVGLPVIASDVGGVKETLGRAGQVVSGAHLDAWHTAINRLKERVFYQQQVAEMETLAHAHDPAVYAQRFLAALASNR